MKISRQQIEQLTKERQIADEISDRLAEDKEFIALSPEEKVRVVRELNQILSHTLYIPE